MAFREVRVYADAGQREALDVRGAYVHDLKAARRTSIPVGPAEVAATEANVSAAAASIRARRYAPNPGGRCRRCEVRTICRFA